MAARIFDFLAGAVACGLLIAFLEYAVPFIRRALTKPHPACRDCKMGAMAKVGRERDEPDSPPRRDVVA